MKKENQKGVRLDRWLWAARFFKTRCLAVEAIAGGKVTVNHTRAKPAKTINPGDRLTVTREGFIYEITIRQCIEKRVSAAAVEHLYEESADSIARRQERIAQLKADRRSVQYERGRPSKRDRRLLEKFKRSHSDF